VIADAALKSIVSGEPTTVEHKFRDPFEFRPYATCWFGTNHLPHTRDFSDALFRRALVVPFNRRFTPGVDADPRLKDKLIEELPGILNLALDAYARVIERGAFTEPESCLQAKKEWRLEADQAAQFVEDCCEVGVGEIQSSDLYSVFCAWAAAAGINHKLQHKSFTQRLERLGFEPVRRNNGRFFTGLKLNMTGRDFRFDLMERANCHGGRT
jgi:putative DNA primase/helicase